jgi:hypothetical protein
MLMFRVVFRLTSILKRSRLELERAIGQFSLGTSGHLARKFQRYKPALLLDYWCFRLYVLTYQQ